MPKIYVDMQDGKPLFAFWRIEDAVRIGCYDLEQAKKNLVEVELSPLSLAVSSYYEFRGYKVPDRHAALLFLMSELGELADEIVQEEGGWVRNHPENKCKGIQGEAADVLMMLLAFSMQPETWFDPIEAMFEKWKSKGLPFGASRRN